MSADKYPCIFSRQMAAIVYIFPKFQNCACCKKDLKNNKRVIHQIFCSRAIGLRATLSGNCSLLGTDDAQGQISEHIFAPNGGYSLFSCDDINFQN